MAIVGIDLGTTNSLVAILQDGRPVTLPNEHGEHMIPSAVAIAGDGAVLVGRAARDRLVRDPDAGRAFFKRDIGSDMRYTFGGRSWTPTECSAWILCEMKRIAELHLQQPVTEAVVTVPAYFRDAQRRATVDAAAIAGLAVARVVNEPTAAALAYGYPRSDGSAEEERRILVFDLGGGTFDVTLVEVFDGVIEVRASAGDSRLGGEDYTDALLQLALARSGLTPTRSSLGRFRQQIEVVKRRLSTRDAAALTLEDRELVLRRSDLKRVAESLTARMRPIVLRCLNDGKATPEQLADVLLVGGASRMPMIGDVLRDLVGVPGQAVLDPDRVVALGAAVQAALCADDRAVSDIVLTDVCPHTLGIEITKTFGVAHEEAGYYLPIIERNTTLPVSRVETVSTLRPDQDTVEVKIYQGEARRVKDNHLLGKIDVPGLRHRTGQQDPGQADVRFSHDMNGILEVEVVVRHSGKAHRAVIEQRPGAISKQEIEAAIRRLRPLKVHPRDRVDHRARLERAHRLFEELSGQPRQLLAAGLDQFEAALATQDDAVIVEAARNFDAFLAQFYRAEGEDQSWLDDEESA